MEMKGNTLAVVLLVVGLCIGAGIGYMTGRSVRTLREKDLSIDVQTISNEIFEHHPTMKIGKETPMFTANIGDDEYLVYYELVGDGWGGVSIWWRYVKV